MRKIAAVVSTVVTFAPVVYKIWKWYKSQQTTTPKSLVERYWE